MRDTSARRSTIASIAAKFEALVVQKRLPLLWYYPLEL